MTRQEAIINLKLSQNRIGGMKKEEWVALQMAIEALEQERPKGEWIFNPTDAIDLMFAKPKCSECGFESSDGGNFCPNCGADMRGDDE